MFFQDSKTYRIGVIGNTDRGGYGHGIDTVWQSVPNSTIVGVSDPNAAGLEKAMTRLKTTAGYADYVKLLDETKPDIVSICPRWIDDHHNLVLAAAQRGIHVYMEKPLCRTLAEADAMIAACEKHKVKVAIAFQTRYSPVVQVIHDLIEDGKIGELIEIRSRGKEDNRGGAEDLWVLGSHLMNLIHYFGGEPNWCCASVFEKGIPVGPSAVREGNEGIGPMAGDHVAATFGLDNNVMATFGSRRNGSAGGKNRFGLIILGTLGAIELTTGYLPRARLLLDPRWTTGYDDSKWVPITSAGPGEPEPIKDGSAHVGNVVACIDLIAAIEDDRQPVASLYEGRTTIEMISAVFESHRQQARVAMPLQNRENPLATLVAQQK